MRSHPSEQWTRTEAPSMRSFSAMKTAPLRTRRICESHFVFSRFDSQFSLSAPSPEGKTMFASSLRLVRIV